MANLHRIREAIFFGYFIDFLDNEEFMMIYDANCPVNADFKYFDYQEFNLEPLQRR